VRAGGDARVPHISNRNGAMCAMLLPNSLHFICYVGGHNRRLRAPMAAPIYGWPNGDGRQLLTRFARCRCRYIHPTPRLPAPTACIWSPGFVRLCCPTTSYPRCRFCVFLLHAISPGPGKKIIVPCAWAFLLLWTGWLTGMTGW
jgi:hypothetical protein